jgi:hypothetical protein
MPLSLEAMAILHKLWGSQSWLQPAFSRLSRTRALAGGSQEPPKKAAAGKIARPTTSAGFVAWEN